MKRLFHSVCLCSALLLLSTACIDHRYDMSKLSLKLAFGGDSLSIPLVSSNGKIFLGTALDSLLQDSIEGLEKDSLNHLYKFEIKDNFSYVLDSAAKAEMGLNELSIEDQNIEEVFEVEGLDASATKISIEGMQHSELIDLGVGDIALENLSLPQTSIEKSFSSDLSKYQLSDSQKHLDINTLHIEQGNLLGEASLPAFLEALAGNLPHEEISLILPSNPSNTLDINLNENLKLSLDVPSALKGIGDIKLKQAPTAANMSIRIQLENAENFLTAGEIIPDIRISPSDIFDFGTSLSGAESSQDIVFSSSDVMNASNHYSISKTIGIKGLNIANDPVDGKMDIQKQISASGNVKVNGIKYYADQITEIKNLRFLVEVAFNDIVIESLSFEIEGQSVDMSGESQLNIQEELPEQIAGIHQIIAKENSYIQILIKGDEKLQPLKDNLSIQAFSLQFPKAFKLAAQEGLDQSSNTFSLAPQAFNPAEGLQLRFLLESVDLSQVPITNGSLSFEDQLSYSGSLGLQGKINSADLPDYAAMDISVSSSLGIQDIIADTKKIEHSLEDIHMSFEEKIERPLKELTSINSATLEDGAFVKLHLQLPKLPLNILAEDIRIALPKMMEFASHPMLNQNNELCINGDIPSDIQLELKKLNINKTFENDELLISESISVKGGIAVEAGRVNAKELSEALKEKIAIDFSLSDMVLSDIGANISGISYQLSDSIAFNEAIEIPSEILRIDSLLLSEGAEINVAFLAENLPELDVPISMDVRLDLPEAFLLSGEDLKDGNIWHFDADIVNGKSIEKSLKIKGLNLSTFDLSSGIVNLNEAIKYDVTVYMAAGEINSSDLSDKPIKVSTKADIKGLQLDKVYGVVDPQIENISESISLSDLPDFMKDPDMVSLEINPVIALSAKSNISIPLVIDGALTPVVGGVNDDNRTQSIHIELPRAASPEEVKEHHFWIAATNADMPQDYEFIQLNVNDILKSIPDELMFNLQVNTDTEVQHELDLNVDYSADLDYLISIPIAFGENSHFAMQDTLDMDMSEFGEYFDYIGECVELFGEIENSIPLNLTAQLEVLDENMEIIEMENEVKLSIKAGQSDGSASVSPISLKLDNKSHRLDQARYFVLKFRVNSDAEVANTPLSPEQYLQAKLKLRVVGGFVVDIDEL